MIAAIIQARTSSNRLPHKVLAPLLGVPMLGRQIERLRRARTLDRIVVATSDGGGGTSAGEAAGGSVDDAALDKAIQEAMSTVDKEHAASSAAYKTRL